MCERVRKPCFDAVEPQDNRAATLGVKPYSHSAQLKEAQQLYSEIVLLL